MLDTEEVVMGIIVNAGHSRSLCYEALHHAKAGDFDHATELLAMAAEAGKEAHAIQTKLIEEDEGMGKTTMTLVMVHAQDHLMTSILCREIITELVQIYKNKLN
ncbi:PTS lactose/cellobiose transporter subunit IIA [Klebsiella electrica]|uniref:PTS lactose/cellobiose transporter subunit IIA n=2 Tax=Klebsiella electrica TaxID=1259973 RepID=A0AAJ5UHD9_9ENTR|nr:PTS lactose/cellobiose transporter subunit IIA [Klebsiella electrica]QDI08648.1 N,N'-diacetylchitobiose-specific phosphotransferase enzyme IIA component [Klebsiella electrica]WBW63755.1 PTS lactose/cellobiose transporter subunit IIA [Klebsiella electrica]WIO40858.1 PTS lactose/cellobiose transporter subunit IIA [Klebsiella electrica]BBV76532.1 molecular chaperone TorD [Raoultella planticola]